MKTRKINFFAATIWKKLFIFKKKPFFKNSDKFIYSRSSTIPSTFRNRKIFIHSGKIWVKKVINKWIVGFKFGELTLNRKPAVYKAKQLRKKKAKKLKNQLLKQK